MRFFILLYIFSGCSLGAYAQTLIKGQVSDSLSREALVGASITLNDSAYIQFSDAQGRFSFQVPKGVYRLKVSYLGYRTHEQLLNINGQQLAVSVYLGPATLQGREVIVNAQRNNDAVKNSRMGSISLDVNSIKTLPVVLGEPDLLKSITLLPGIKSGGEGGTGFYVRGGGPDQNLILLDDAVIYNPSHLLGFFSVFNTDAAEEVEIIKGGMPASYGGRLSSIVKVNTREGNFDKHTANASIGLISSRLTVSGPMQKGKSSFSIGARRTYIDVLAKPFLPDSLRKNGYYFYDLNARMDFRLGGKDKLSITSYLGRDVFRFEGTDVRSVKVQTNWGNAFVSARWTHLFSSAASISTSFTLNSYQLQTDAGFGSGELILRSGISDRSLKSDYQIRLSGKHSLKAGLQYTYHIFTPGIASGEQGGVSFELDVNKKYAHEAALYVHHDWEPGSRLLISYGFRYSYFNQVGPYSQAVYDENGDETDSTVAWKKGQSVAAYGALEPRLNLRYSLNESSSLKGSVTRVNQYLHLATSSGATLPSDLWVPSSGLVKPQISWQYALGYYQNLKDNMLEASVETYYKTMQNQVEFKPGANLFLNQNLEGEMVFGSGLAYGVEFLLRKKTGRTNGWLGYTLSRTTRQFPDLNGGERFDYRYDRRHDISLVLNHQFSKRLQFSFVFVYGTGNALTLPTGRYAFNVGIDNVFGIPVRYDNIDQYGPINAYRMPAYHRADLSLTWLRKKTKHRESSWNFSIYNVYNRKNPYFIYFSADQEDPRPQAYMVYLFPILPSVSWTCKFF